jgi:tRNA-dihydrouridine synthase
MQDVTDLPFWRLMRAYGGADLYYTEYFRVHAESRLDRNILASVIENPTGCPVSGQLIGNDVEAMVRAARELEQHPVAAVDLNLGCPAPVVYRKCAGGGLLRDMARVDRLVGSLRDAVTGRFTVKTRIGFDDPAVFEELLPILARHRVDLVAVHGRTVVEGYRSAVHYDFIARAVEALPCPVLANGNIYSAQKSAEVLESTGARGVMIGRAAIRNPWLFTQIRQHRAGESVTLPSGWEVLRYVEDLYEAVCTPGFGELAQVQKMKKYLNFLGLGVEPTGEFLHRVRRVRTRGELFGACRDFLAHDEPMSLEPFKIALGERDVLAGEAC